MLATVQRHSTGGAVGGRLAGRVDPEALRHLVVGVGIAVALVYLLRLVAS